MATLQAVSSLGQTSTWLPVTQSIIQGSGIGPCLYLIYASDLRTLLASTAAYVDRLLMQVNEWLYLLSLLQSTGLQRCSLHLLFNVLVINKLTYALPAYAGQLTADDKNRIKNAISRKAMHRGPWTYTYRIWHWHPHWRVRLQTLSAATQPGHSLRHLLSPKTSTTDLTSFVRGNIHISFPLRSLKIVISVKEL